MKLVLKRIRDNGKATAGELYIDGTFFSYTLEDEHRDKKVAGETRIPSGTYDVDFNPNVTKLTQKYRNRFEWFSYHIHIKDVPNFQGIYIHVGNYETQTEGCVLLGDMVTYGKTLSVLQSVRAYKRFYPIVENALADDEKITLEIIDDVN